MGSNCVLVHYFSQIKTREAFKLLECIPENTIKRQKITNFKAASRTSQPTWLIIIRSHFQTSPKYARQKVRYEN